MLTIGTSYYLESTNDTRDRSRDIAAMLSQCGRCDLGVGDFYIDSGIDMPENSFLTGCGNKTNLILSGAAGDTYAVRMRSYTMVENLHIEGGISSETAMESPDIGKRHGILWRGNANGKETGVSPVAGMIRNVRITGFIGGGITCGNTGYGTENQLTVSDCFISSCRAGVNIDYWSEFHRLSNVKCMSCYYGSVNNGGNNVFVNCDFTANMVGMLFDNARNQSPNNTHGSVIGCTFNHEANNTGYAVKILNCESGEIFEGCQIFFAKTLIENSDGIVFAHCDYGKNNCDITVNGGGTVLFHGNIHQDTPKITVTDNPNVRFIDCYVRTNGAKVGI